MWCFSWRKEKFCIFNEINLVTNERSIDNLKCYQVLLGKTPTEKTHHQIKVSWSSTTKEISKIKTHKSVVIRAITHNVQTHSYHRRPTAVGRCKTHQLILITAKRQNDILIILVISGKSIFLFKSGLK